MLFFKDLVLFNCLAALSTASPLASASRKCPVVLEGRVPLKTTLKTFDTDASLFNPNYTKGENVSWSQIIKFPVTLPSRFDLPRDKAIEVTIDDRSIFLPGGGSLQYGFRRAGLLLGNGSDASNVGVKTYHWSAKQDKRRPLNLTHEYMMVWHEANDYSHNQFSINAGVMLSQDNPTDGGDSTKVDKHLWKILDRYNDIVWTTPIKQDTWQNFAVTLDYDKNTLQVHYSEGYGALKAVTEPLDKDMSGGGQYQIGILKKPTETISVVNDGYQESGINEGQIYGGIFVEDSANSCITL